MTAWWAWVGHDAARRWRSALVLAVLLSIGGGVVLSGFVGARRNATALTRLAARVLPATAMALPNEPGFDWGPVADLPYVRSMHLFAVSGFDVAGHPDANEGFPRAAPPIGDPMELQVVLAGRVADQSRIDEIVVSPSFSRRAGVRVGDQLTLEVPGPGVVEAMIEARSPPDVPSIDVPVRVVGVAKGVFWGGDLDTTVAFYRRYHDQLTPPGVGYVNAVLGLAAGRASLPRLQADLEDIAGRPIEAVDFSQGLAKARTATDVESSALLAFAAVAAIVTAVLGGIAIVRAVAASSAEIDTLRAIGFTRRQTVTAAAARPAMAALTGAIGAVVVAVLLSGRYPIGVGRYFEPAPGRHANIALLALGATGLAVAGVAAAVLAAWRLGRAAPPVTAGLRTWVAGPWEAPPAWLPVAMGARLAVERRTSGGRAATLALGFGVTVTVAALTFGAGLERGSSDGTLSGQPFDTVTVGVGDNPPPAEIVEAWRADDRIVAATRVRNTVAVIDSRAVAVFALTDLKGTFDDHPRRGRLPAAGDEIALAPTEMSGLDVSVGDTVTLAGRSMRVVGEVFTPEMGHTSYDEGARVTPAVLDALVQSGDPIKFDSLALRVSTGVPPDQFDDLWHGIEHDRGGRVEAQFNLRPTRALPRLLAAFVVVLTIGAAGYSIASTARRRRWEVAVLQVLGFTRRQARATVGWHAATAAALALVVGVPLGFAIGRTLWQSLANDLPLRYVRPGVGLTVLAVVAGSAVITALVSLRPVHVTARDEPAALLRAE